MTTDYCLTRIGYLESWYGRWRRRRVRHGHLFGCGDQRKGRLSWVILCNYPSLRRELQTTSRRWSSTVSPEVHSDVECHQHNRSRRNNVRQSCHFDGIKEHNRGCVYPGVRGEFVVSEEWRWRKRQFPCLYCRIRVSYGQRWLKKCSYKLPSH